MNMRDPLRPGAEKAARETLTGSSSAMRLSDRAMNTT